MSRMRVNFDVDYCGDERCHLCFVDVDDQVIEVVAVEPFNTPRLVIVEYKKGCDAMGWCGPGCHCYAKPTTDEHVNETTAQTLVRLLGETNTATLNRLFGDVPVTAQPEPEPKYEYEYVEYDYERSED